MKGQNFPYRRHISKEEIQHLESFKYTGKVRIIDSKAKIDKFNRLPLSGEILGFDTETRPSFKKGVQHDCSLVQMAFSDEVVLFRLNKIGFPPILEDMLSHNEAKIGIAIHDDIRQLKQLRPFEEKSFVDLNSLCPKIGFESIGAKRLTAIVLGKKISKRQQLSNWEAKELSNAQVDYAATDAWICRLIYNELHQTGLISPEMI